MANIDYSIGFTTTEVEEILSIQKRELKKTLSAYSDNGSSVTKRRIDEINTIISSCQRALQKLAPEKYPPLIRVAVSYVDRPLGL
jgi:hypothetical protein